MTFKKSLLISFLSFSGIIVGCGGSSGPEAPQAPIVLTSENAIPIANAAVVYAEIGSSVTGAEANIPQAKKALDTIVNIAFDKNRQIPSVVQGITTSIGCGPDGTSGSTEFNGTGDTMDVLIGSNEGTITFNNCVEFGITINGSFSIASSWNGTTGEYSNSGSGNMSLSAEGISFSMGLDYTGNGNDITGAFSNDFAFSIFSPQFPGFTAETTQSLTGFYGTIEAGTILVTGGNNTYLEIIFTGSGWADVYLDSGDGFPILQDAIYTY